MNTTNTNIGHNIFNKFVQTWAGRLHLFAGVFTTAQLVEQPCHVRDLVLQGTLHGPAQVEFLFIGNAVLFQECDVFHTAATTAPPSSLCALLCSAFARFRDSFGRARS